MPRVDEVEKKVCDVEGFQIVIAFNGKDVRGDAQLPKQYEAIRMTRNSFSVSEWADKFKTQFPGFTVAVLKSDGKKASGQTKLSTVRDTYLSE